MAPRVGYVSSFDEWERFGFIRPADDPRSLVKFHQSALNDTTFDRIAVGLEVRFELDPNQEPTEEWPVVSSVTIGSEAGDDEDDATITEIDRL